MIWFWLNSCCCSVAQLRPTLCQPKTTVVCQAPLSRRFSRQQYWSGLSCPPPGTFPTQGLNPRILCPLNWQLDSCQEPARDIPLMTKVMRKEAWQTQRRYRASGVPLDILEHLPPKQNQSLPTLLLFALTSDFTGGSPPPPSHSLCQRVNLQFQLIKFLGN